jgi:hypothetical protein
MFPSLVIPCCFQQEKVRDAELAVRETEKHAMSRVEQVIAAVEKERSNLQAECDKAELKLSSVQAEAAIAGQLQSQLSERERLDAVKSAEIKALKQEVQRLMDSQTRTELCLQHAKEREKVLEQIVTACSDGSNGVCRNPVVDQIDSNHDDEGEEGEVVTSSISNLEGCQDSTLQLLKLTQQRYTDVEIELAHMKAHVNDLILEIDGVSTKEMEARRDAERLLGQVSNCQGFQRDALQENYKLQNQLEELKKSNKDMQIK